MQETNYGTDIAIVPRKSYIILKRRKRFAVNKAGTRDRLDLGLRLTGCEATERLQDARGFGRGSIIHIVSLHEAGDRDGEVLARLCAAYDAAG